jgi:hypothetical protein
MNPTKEHENTGISFDEVFLKMEQAKRPKGLIPANDDDDDKVCISPIHNNFPF